VYAWAAPGDPDPDRVASITCTIEWPPRSGRRLEIPEVDRCAWFDLPTARAKIKETQAPLIDRLEVLLSRPAGDGPTPGGRGT
jgi:predicted NUDIX family NTP pyrophosphohydrolase